MTIRPFRESDLSALKQIHAQNGFAFDFPDMPKMLAAFVVTDEQDKPMMMLSGEPSIELHLIAGPLKPAAKMHCIGLLTGALRSELARLGWSGVSANAFVPPVIEKAFGNRLMRTFGFLRNWASFCVKV